MSVDPLASFGPDLRDKLANEADVHSESRGAGAWRDAYGIHSLPAVFSSERYFLPPP
jgi:hypothetical protein